VITRIQKHKVTWRRRIESKASRKHWKLLGALPNRFGPDSGARDKERRLPFEEIEWFSQSGLWGITVPKEYGGAGVSTAIFAEVVAIVSEADASIGQIPQNHYANVEEIRLVGTEAQKAFFFDRILKGDRLGNAAVERSGKTVLENQTKLVPDGDGYRLTGEKFYSTGALFAHWVPVRVTDSDGNRVVSNRSAAERKGPDRDR